MIDYRHLNHYIPPASESLSDAWKRAMGRLGDITATIVRSLNLRPTAVSLLGQTDAHLLVRLTLPSEYLVLRIAPEDDLAAYTHFVRLANGLGVPSAKIIQRDLSRTTVPFAYSLESYVAGVSVAHLADPHKVRGAARQAGRSLRRLHRHTLPAFGAPLPTGRWPTARWLTVLKQIGERLAPLPADQLLFQPEEQAAVAALIAGPKLICQKPVLVHGAFTPAVVRCTAGEHIHLEAIVDPGRVIGGDGMFDLAFALRPSLPEPWREGLYEGYLSAGPLSDDEEERLRALRLLVCYWGACYSYMRACDHTADMAEARRLICEFAPQGSPA